MTRFLWPAALLLSLAGFLLFGGPAAGDCAPDVDTTPIAAVTGAAGDPLAEGQAVWVDGVISGVFPGREGLDGFFIQSPEAGAEPVAGVFVYAPGFTAADWRELAPGARVRLEARTGRWQGRPQLQRVATITLCAAGEPPAPAVLELPAGPGRLEMLHGRLVSLPQELVITGNHLLGRFGSLELSAGERLFRHGVPDDGRLHRLVLDDGSYRRNPEPIPYLDKHGTRRAGDRLDGLTGILVDAFDDWRLHPVERPAFRSGNPRPETPDRPEGLRVATFNLENYFISLGRRGAEDAAGLARQRDKLLAALEPLDADLLALVEVENDRAALEDLVSHLNRRLPEQRRYRLLDGPDDTGDDVIKVALVYRSSELEALGAARSDTDPVHHRPPVMAAFRDRRSGEPLIAAVVHFKSKTGCPSSGDVDRGQGCWNMRRTDQTRALLASVAAKAEARGTDRVILAGDFNSYAGEDPVRLLERAGYVNAVAESLPPSRRYSYVFRGEAGTLDYVFASAGLAADITGATVWHINADEPAFLSYDGRGGRDAASLGQPWRSSDHDPVMIGIRR